MDEQEWLDRRTPQKDRLFGRMIERLPFHLCGDVVHGGRELAPASPRAARVVEVVGAQNVTPPPPSARVARRVHASHAEADVLDGGHVPAQVMERRSRAAQESDE